MENTYKNFSKEELINQIAKVEEWYDNILFELDQKQEYIEFLKKTITFHEKHAKSLTEQINSYLDLLEIQTKSKDKKQLDMIMNIHQLIPTKKSTC